MKIYYVAEGDVCGPCGHKHRTLAGAERCARSHGNAISKAYPSKFPTQSYSDRSPKKYVDGEAIELSEAEMKELDEMRRS